MTKRREKLNTVVVSLQSAVERRSDCTENLQQNRHIDWRFFDAMTSSAPCAVESDPIAQISHIGRHLTANEIGCFKSHFCVLKEFVASTESDWLLVLEDDVWLDPNFALFEVVDFAEAKGIGYVRLFAKAYKPASIVGSLSGFRHIIRFHSDPFGAQAYVINKRFASRFVTSLDRILRPIDDELGRFWQNGLVPFAVFPFPAIEKSVPSQLDESRTSVTRDRAKYRFDLIAFRITEWLKKRIHNIKLRIDPFHQFADHP
jgi:glycosyl transferase, family 25